MSGPVSLSLVLLFACKNNQIYPHKIVILLDQGVSFCQWRDKSEKFGQSRLFIKIFMGIKVYIT